MPREGSAAPGRRKRPAVIAAALVLVLFVAGAPVAEARFGNDSDPVLVGAHVATGFGGSRPYVFGQIGVRFTERHLFLGVELSSLLQAGFAADALIYVVKLRPVAVHLFDPGIGWSPFGYTVSTPDVKRSIDLRLGAGVEIRVCRHASLTADWKVSFPNPAYVITNYGDYGKTIFLDALKESQLWIGVLIH